MGLKLLSNLNIRELKKSELKQAFNILNNEIKERQRSNRFLLEKYNQFSQFFIGLFLDNELIGVICGFPRENYLLISEIVIDSRFQKRGFGKRLVKKFEEVARDNNFNKINAGARDNAINFYNSLNYKPFLLIQYKKNEYSDYKKFKLDIIKIKKGKTYITIEAEVKEINLNLLKRLRHKYPKAYFQYIFTKNI